MPPNILTPSKITPEDRLRDAIDVKRTYLEGLWRVMQERERYYAAEKVKLIDLERQLREIQGDTWHEVG